MTPELLEIAVRARTLDERLAARGKRTEPGSVDSMAAWARSYAAGDEDALRRRLGWDGLDEAFVREALSSSGHGGSFPSWIETLESALTKGKTLAAEASLPDLTRYPTRTVPRFGEVWIPFVIVARERLAARAGAALDDWGEEALLALEGSLLAQISWIAEQTLYEAFDDLRRKNSDGEFPAGLYRTFVLDLLSGGLVPLFKKYGALARQLSLMAENWTDAVAELVLRVAADQEDLGRLFGASGGVAQVVTGLSDRHAGGRTILMLGFRSGAWVVYKPRTVGMEGAWNDFLRFLTERGAGALAHLRVLVRDGYGYVERVQNVTLTSVEEARSYFRSAGSLLAAAWVMGADDLHMDNVIATPLGPAVVDAEAFLQPAFATGSAEAGSTEGAGAGALSRWSARANASMLRSGLLTIPWLDRDGASVDIGGLTGEGGHPARTKSRAFRDSNTDEMTLVSEVSLSPATLNLPILEGRRLVPRDFPDEVAEGFASMLRALVSLMPEIAGAGGPLEALAKERTRLVFRPSDLYARVLLELSAPRFLMDGLERSFAIDSLNAVFRRERVRPRLWPLTVEERLALENFDIPYFSIPGNSRTILAGSGEPVEGHLLASGHESARRRLHSLRDGEPGLQLSALVAHLSSKPGSHGPAPDELLELAEQIGADVQGADFEEASEPDSLYGGRLGVALFLGALFQTTGKPEFRESARSLWRASAETIRGVEPLPVDAPVGACNGVGSWIYALSLLSHFCGDEEPLALARDAAALLTPERIACSGFDVESGSAGAILGLLALHALTNDEAVLDRAVECGAHLLESRIEIAEGIWGWPSDTGTCLAGFAHGAAGIALGLGRLSEATGRTDFHEAAVAACRYETTLYDSVQGNWPILSKSGERLFLTAWCHGAPGIALARAGLLASGHNGRSSASGLDGGIVESLRAALTTTRAASLLSTDHLCCGNAGLVETLLVSGEVSGRSDLVEAARARAALLLDAALSRGSFRFQTSGSERFAPGFWRGLSGVGYLLLRLSKPSALPSVLAFESTRNRRMKLTNPTAVRLQRLTAEEASAFSALTFPAYRHLLALERAPRHLGMALLRPVLPVACGAFFGEVPVGLALAEIPDDPAEGAELLSLFVQQPYRGNGIATSLLESLSNELSNLGLSRVHAVYMTGQPSQSALERVLSRCGWTEPVPRMLSVRITLEKLRRTDWYGRYRLDPEFEIFPWISLTSAERDVLFASQQERGWIAPNLEPWKHDADGFEPVSSVGVRYRGSVVGWVINHAVSDKVVRFTCSFIRKDFGRRGKLVPVYTESIRRLLETEFESCTFTVPLQHRGMAAFTLRWIGALASFTGETRGTEKSLGARAVP